jgi:photosystem II stability/assembly factor-like uncharacterized protein
MKHILKYILFFIISGNVLYLQSQDLSSWKKLDSPTSQLLKCIHFIDSNTGWIGGDGGTIIGTTDGGNNWNILYSAPDTYILDIFFLDSQFGWILFWDTNPPFATKLLITIDGGNNWTQEICPGDNPFYYSVYFLDSLTGFLAGPPILKTIDGGESWYEVTVFDVDTIPPDLSQLPTRKINFFNDHIGYACGGYLDFAGVMWWTTDKGEYWSAIGLGPDPINDFHIFDSLIVLGLAGDPEFLFGTGKVKTTDGGNHWEFTELNLDGVVNAMSFRTCAEGWAAIENKFIITIDSGVAWNEYPTPNNIIIEDLVFTDSLTGYAVGDSGIILKYNAPSTSGNKLPDPSLPYIYSLSQNYPNPFNPSTMISYQLPAISEVTLKVYDVLGNEIATLADECKPAGRYKAEFNTSALASGVYFYQLIAGSFVETKKMLLLK